jgi:hypothetical protein
MDLWKHISDPREFVLEKPYMGKQVGEFLLVFN